MDGSHRLINIQGGIKSPHILYSQHLNILPQMIMNVPFLTDSEMAELLQCNMLEVTDDLLDRIIQFSRNPETFSQSEVVK